MFLSFIELSGASAAMIFSSLGAAIGMIFSLFFLNVFSHHFEGTAKAGAGIAGMGQYRPQLIMKALVPVVMASIIGIYGLVVAVLISGSGTCDTHGMDEDVLFFVYGDIFIWVVIAFFIIWFSSL